jgi:hypothetical protein
MRTISFIAISILIIFSTSCTNIDFDSERWKSVNNSEADWSVRWDMSEDLIRNYGLVGKTKIEINELLGDSGNKCETDNCLISYDLGPCHRGINYGTLSITIEDGYVTNVKRTCG